MTTISRIAATAAAAIAITAGSNAIAHADNNTYGGGYTGDHDAYAYWNLLTQVGASNTTVDKAGQFGMTICQGLNSGVSEGYIVHDAATSGIPPSAARVAVHGAEFHFCPDQLSP